MFTFFLTFAALLKTFGMKKDDMTTLVRGCSRTRYYAKSKFLKDGVRRIILNLKLLDIFWGCTARFV